LVVFADPEFEASGRLLKALDSKAQTLLRAGGRYVVISVDKDPAAARRLGVRGVLFSSKDQQPPAPGSPFVYLLGRDGKVIRSWLGYDAANEKALVDEIGQSLAEAGVK
jgi:hypothetical protein